MTTKRKILFWIPFGIVSACLAYSWALFLFTDAMAVFQHYLGLGLYGLLLYFLLGERNARKTLVYTGIYILLAVVNFISFFPFIASSSLFLTVAGIKFYTPGFNMMSFLILVLYAILNFDSLSDIYLDHKESKGKL